MARITLKNKAGAALDLDGRHVLVRNASGTDTDVDSEIQVLRTSLNGLIAASDALVYKGVVDTSKFPPSGAYRTGWTYKVGAAGIYAGNQCEVGDMLICISSLGEAPANSDWQVVQTNIDGAVIGPSSAVSGDLASFDGITGRIIADSSVKTADAVDAVAKRHAHDNAAVLNNLGTDASGKLTFKDKSISDGLVDCVVINAGDAIPENLRDNGIIFEIQE